MASCKPGGSQDCGRFRQFSSIFSSWPKIHYMKMHLPTHVLGVFAENDPICFLGVRIFLRGEKLIEILRLCCIYIVLGYWWNSVDKEECEHQAVGGAALHQKFEKNISRNETCGLAPNFCIHVSVSDLYIPTMGPPILLYCICETIVGLYIALTDTWIYKLGTRPHSSNLRYSAIAMCLPPFPSCSYREGR